VIEDIDWSIDLTGERKKQKKKKEKKGEGNSFCFVEFIC
jgi:hypothetical protein